MQASFQTHHMLIGLLCCCSMFFPTWSFTLPTTVVRIPVSALETGLWAVLTYWTVGLTPQPGQ